MNTTPDFDQRLRAHFGDRADLTVLDGQLDGVLDRTANSRQRPGWLAALRSTPMTTRSISGGAAIPRVAWVPVLVVLMLVLILAAAIVAGARPAGPPVNGRLLFGRFEESSLGTVFYTVDPGRPGGASSWDLTDGSHLARLRPEANDSARWSPDGETILLAATVADALTETYTDSVVNADGSGYRTLPLIGSYAPLILACSDWSPDATRLLCEGWNYVDPSRNGLYTLDSSDGGHLVRVTAPPDSNNMHGGSGPGQAGGRDIPGTFSPDGTMIAFAGFIAPPTDGTSGNGLMIVNADGTGRQRVGTLDIGDRPEWSPDGRSILVSSQGGLYSVDVATGSATLLAKGQPDAGLGGATWSPDGTRILFKKYGGGAVFYTMRLDGTDIDLVEGIPRGASDADWGTHPLGG